MIPDWDAITIVCTNRGQHAPATLGGLRTVSRSDTSINWRAIRENPAWQASNDGEPRPAVRPRGGYAATGASFDGQRRVRFQCQRCGRDVPWSEDTAQRILDGMLAADRRVLDVSLMPT